MDRVSRLRNIAKGSYYLGWTLTVVAIIVHITKLAPGFGRLTGISDRNLLEAGALLFLICLASEARAAGFGSSPKPAMAKAQAA